MSRKFVGADYAPILNVYYTADGYARFTSNGDLYYSFFARDRSNILYDIHFDPNGIHTTILQAFSTTAIVVPYYFRNVKYVDDGTGWTVANEWDPSGTASFTLTVSGSTLRFTASCGCGAYAAIGNINKNVSITSPRYAYIVYSATRASGDYSGLGFLVTYTSTDGSTKTFLQYLVRNRYWNPLSANTVYNGPDIVNSTVALAIRLPSNIATVTNIAFKAHTYCATDTHIIYWVVFL